MSIPAQLNHYRILEPLGKGGMGEVFAAEDTKLHRKVALKVLSALMAADPERRQRFERLYQLGGIILKIVIANGHRIALGQGS